MDINEAKCPCSALVEATHIIYAVELKLLPLHLSAFGSTRLRWKLSY